jgi:hypothetical protein
MASTARAIIKKDDFHSYKPKKTIKKEDEKYNFALN